jgi:hypothetical protein
MLDLRIWRLASHDQLLAAVLIGHQVGLFPKQRTQGSNAQLDRAVTLRRNVLPRPAAMKNPTAQAIELGNLTVDSEPIVGVRSEEPCHRCCDSEAQLADVRAREETLPCHNSIHETVFDIMASRQR